VIVSLTSADGLEIAVYAQVRDIADAPVIAPVLNSLAAQEFGDDFGDYYRATGARLGVRVAIGGRGEWRFALTRDQVASLPVRATPATGRYRANPAMQDGTYTSAALTLRRRSEGFAVRRDVAGEATLEVGEQYARLSGTGHLLVPAGASRILTRVQVGLATADLPAHRAFVLGGRGTLLGDDFRAWGGRRAALLHLEWRAPVPFIRLKAGPARTPGTLILTPYAAWGWAAEPIVLTPWRATPGTRMTLGLGAEWLGLFRLEAGYGLQTGQVHVGFDVARDFWDIL
jgi:hypothetical protein